MRCTAKHERQTTNDLLVAEDPWAAATAALRDASAPEESAAFGALYELVRREGRGMLRSFQKIDDARKDDLAFDALDAALPALLRADSPRAYFAKALRNKALSWRRSPRAAVASPDGASEARGSGGPVDGEERLALARLDAGRALDALRPRERAVLLADAEGWSREEIAAMLCTSRANVDQIVSRARRRVQRPRSRGEDACDYVV